LETVEQADGKMQRAKELKRLIGYVDAERFIKELSF